MSSLTYWTKKVAKDLLSKILSLLSSFFVAVQVSTAYVSIGLTNVLWIIIFVFLESSCDSVRQPEIIRADATSFNFINWQIWTLIVCTADSSNRTETLFAQDVGFFSVKTGGT
jgi:hypothetical protein